MRRRRGGKSGGNQIRRLPSLPSPLYHPLQCLWAEACPRHSASILSGNGRMLTPATTGYAPQRRYPAMAMFKSDDPDAADKMREMFSPGQIDQSVRQAIQMCWMMLPQGTKTVEELEKQFRRIVDRALK